MEDIFFLSFCAWRNRPIWRMTRALPVARCRSRSFFANCHSSWKISLCDEWKLPWSSCTRVKIKRNTHSGRVRSRSETVLTKLRWIRGCDSSSSFCVTVHSVYVPKAVAIVENTGHRAAPTGTLMGSCWSTGKPSLKTLLNTYWKLSNRKSRHIIYAAGICDVLKIGYLCRVTTFSSVYWRMTVYV